MNMALALWIAGIVVLMLMGRVTLQRGSHRVKSGAEHSTAAAGADFSLKASPAMQIGVSVVLLGAALYIILSGGYDNDTSKWAFGAVGTVVGFWLKG